MSLKLKGNGTINHTVQLVTDLANISNPEVNDICIVTDENLGGMFVYRSGTWTRMDIVLESPTKTWKLNVDDSGTISAVEVV